MHSPVHAPFESWSLPVPLTLVLILAAFLYGRGWFRLRKPFPKAIPVWQFGSFVSGLLSLWIALGSPLAAFDHYLLSIHMIEHVLLMAVAPPLILLGAPFLAFLHGLPQRLASYVRSYENFVPVLGGAGAPAHASSTRDGARVPPGYQGRRHWLARWARGLFLHRPSVQQLGRILTHPVLCWLVAMVTLVAWHVPALFALTLRSHSLHEIEYAGFFATGLLFWLPVVQPWPSVARWPRWCIPLYLFLATLPCDALSAFLAFCDRVVYSSYLTAPRLFDMSPLQDQQCAGALMWTCATFLYLIPAVVVSMQLLSPTVPEQPEPLGTELQRQSFPADLEVVRHGN